MGMPVLVRVATGTRDERDSFSGEGSTTSIRLLKAFFLCSRYTDMSCG
jgi:hypothetical protein